MPGLEAPPLPPVQLWIEPVLPGGVCAVGGYSAGCATAAELARQLQERGVRVTQVVLVDGLPAHHAAGSFDDIEMLAGWATQFGLPPVEVGELRPLGRVGAITWIFARLPAAARDRLMTPDLLDRMLHAAERSLARAEAWTPRPLDVPAVLLRSLERGDAGSDDGWSAHLGVPVAVIPVAGEHTELMKPPHAQAVAAIIARLLEDHKPTDPQP